MGGSQEPEMGAGGGGVVLKWGRWEIFEVSLHGFFFFLKSGFTPCEAEQPPRGMQLQEKKQKSANPLFYEDLH